MSSANIQSEELIINDNDSKKYSQYLANKKWSEKNKDRVKNLHKKWREKNKEKVKAWGKRYYQENKEKISIKQLGYRKKYRQIRLSEKEKYLAENKDSIIKHRKFKEKSTHLKNTYGITLENYEKMLLEQNGVCKICGKKPVKRSLHVDHCHKTNIIRGLLCANCNLGLGNFKDNENLLKLAIEYLNNYTKKSF